MVDFGKARQQGCLVVWSSGLRVRGSLTTLATSIVCPGNSGFSSVICTSCSSVMVACKGGNTETWKGESIIHTLSDCCSKPKGQPQEIITTAAHSQSLAIKKQWWMHSRLAIPITAPQHCTSNPLPCSRWKYQGGAAARVSGLYIGATPYF